MVTFWTALGRDWWVDVASWRWRPLPRQRLTRRSEPTSGTVSICGQGIPRHRKRRSSSSRRSCGGELGVKKPGIALTRLRWAAGQSPFGLGEATEALRRLVEARPAQVREAVGVWLDDDKLRIQALVVFLAIASSESGAAFLLRNAEEESDRRRFIEAWQQLSTTEDAREAVDSQLTKWGELADRGVLRRDALVDLLADVYEPAIYRNGLSWFCTRLRLRRIFLGAGFDRSDRPKQASPRGANGVAMRRSPWRHPHAHA